MANNASPAHAHEHHIVPTSTYLLTLIALVILMVATVLIAQVQLPAIGPFSGTAVNQLVALFIAIVKGLLVFTIFMGVKWGTKLIKLWAVTGFVWLFLIFTILGDYTTRHYEPTPGWDGKVDGALPRVTPEEPIIPGPKSNDLNVKIRQ